MLTTELNHKLLLPASYCSHNSQIKKCDFYDTHLYDKATLQHRPPAVVGAVIGTSQNLLSKLSSEITMCRAAAYKSSTCPHRWLTVTSPCGPGMGFDSAHGHSFTGETALFGGPRFLEAPAHTCPHCNKKDQYDPNLTRLVTGNAGCCGYDYGYGYGGGPVICCNVM